MEGVKGREGGGGRGGKVGGRRGGRVVGCEGNGRWWVKGREGVGGRGEKGRESRQYLHQTFLSPSQFQQ